MLSKVFQRFVEKSPVSVMGGGLLERVLNPDRLDEWFDCVAAQPYTRELLFSTGFARLRQVGCGLRPVLPAAYQAAGAELSVAITSVSNKRNGVEPERAAALVHDSAHEVRPRMTEMGGRGASFVPGDRTTMLDGTCLAAAEHRLQERRRTAAGAVPGTALVVRDPAWRRATAVGPCEAGDTQERALVQRVLPQVEAGEGWVADRTVCTRPCLCGLVERGAAVLLRQPQGLPWEPGGPERPVGRAERGRGYEHPSGIPAEDGRVLRLRRVRFELDHPTQEGATESCLLTHLPPAVADAQRVARGYRKRGTIEHAFQDLATFLHSEINTLGYPPAALLGFGVAWVAYNGLAVLKAALSCVHGVDKIDHEVSGDSLADDIAGTSRGMLIAIPPEEWHLFSLLTIPQLAVRLLQLARRVNLAAFRKHPRGPKNPTPRRHTDKRHPQVSTARLLAQRKVLPLSPWKGWCPLP